MKIESNETSRLTTFRGSVLAAKVCIEHHVPAAVVEKGNHFTLAMAMLMKTISFGGQIGLNA
eukprot:scaffold13262_cov83-Skeletonema_dohrnii-CCMP3373.AAC.1